MGKELGEIGPSKYSIGGMVELAGVYYDGSLAMRVLAQSGEPRSRPTVCLSPDGPLECYPFVWLKSWAENEGIPMALVEAGIVELTGGSFDLGNDCLALHAKLLGDLDNDDEVKVLRSLSKAKRDEFDIEAMG